MYLPRPWVVSSEASSSRPRAMASPAETRDKISNSRYLAKQDLISEHNEIYKNNQIQSLDFDSSEKDKYLGITRS